MKKDNAFTGLEAAIVLIAFVVVAAVFSYVLLGAGFFATQKAQEVTYAGIQQTTSNMYLVGQIYGDATVEPGSILTTLNLKLGVPEGGQPQNATQIQLLISNDQGLPTALEYGVDWRITHVNGNPPGATPPAGFFNLYPGDKADIEIDVDPSFKISSINAPGNSKSFTLEIKPRIGASYLIARTLSTGYTNGPLY